MPASLLRADMVSNERKNFSEGPPGARGGNPGPPPPSARRVARPLAQRVMTLRNGTAQRVMKALPRTRRVMTLRNVTFPMSAAAPPKIVAAHGHFYVVPLHRKVYINGTSR